MAKYDIVYILKNDISSDEIRYSLRSVCENFPFKRIIFIGGCPEGIKPDVYIPHEQTGSTKWQRARSSLLKILKDENISDKFFLFNDDFYVLKKQKENFINFANGTIENRIREIERKTKKTSSYSEMLRALQRNLLSQKKDTVNFALHLPMLIDRKEALKILTENGKEPMFRSFYANFADIPYIRHKDVKIYDLDSLPIFDDYLSTSDESFKNGAVGVWIRDRFPEPCKYEILEEQKDDKQDL